MSKKLTLTEVSILFSRIAALDSRKTTTEAVEAFAAALIPMTPADAMAAVDMHRQASSEWLLPVHINEIVTRRRNQRLRMAGDPVPPAQLADDPAKELEWRRGWAMRVGDGLPPTEAVHAMDTLVLKEIGA